MGYNRKYTEKILTNPLPRLSEDDRIYFNVPYMANSFAKISNCGFDDEKKLWFTGLNNSSLYALVELYGVDGATSENMKQLLKEKLGSE